ncbi:MAG: sugar transferase [Clostridia bacterium]|nr:sugar transferase [Clostridia bacterium]
MHSHLLPLFCAAIPFLKQGSLGGKRGEEGLALISLAIILEDGRPVFYTQKRVGRNGCVFAVYKCRSMVKDAEKLTGPVLASEDDPRVTRV